MKRETLSRQTKDQQDSFQSSTPMESFTVQKTKQKQKAITQLLNKLINLKIHLQTTVNLHTTREKRERNAQTLENVTR